MKNRVLSVHPIANMYPMMQKKEYENLLNSIEENGYDVTQPITLYKGLILDGRNRYNACIELDIAYVTRVFEGTDEEALEESRRLNSYRRHLENDQRAMCAAYEVIQSRDKKPKISVAFATELHSVSSKRQVERAIAIINYDEKMAKNVFNGKTRLYEAYQAMEQIEALKNPRPTVESQTSEKDEYDQTQTQEQMTQKNLELEQLKEESLQQKNYLQQLEEENRQLKEDCAKKISEKSPPPGGFL